tara:strand:- start:6541 stop:8976 length:2436 start_codon:yes stop_codon:yes gene_type:complete
MEQFTYDEALKGSESYFNGQALPAKVFVDKYALRDSEDNLLENSPLKMHQRMAKEFARIESGKFKVPLTEKEIFNYFDGFKYICPQGSPMYGIGNSHSIVSLSNCYVLDAPLDSYSSILEVDEQLVNISKRRGGVGICLDNLRPKGTLTRNSARSSTGIVSWMRRYSNSIREVGQNSRRGALMLTLSVHHPDILDFATIKNDDKEVTGANISITLTKEFLKALENNEEYELHWPLKNPTITEKVSAKMVWNTIIHSAWLRAEPGLIMWDNVERFTPTEVYDHYKSLSSNPCSEILLNALDSCRLICINLLSFVESPFTKKAYFNWKKFKEVSKVTQRLMDDLVDLESEKIDQILVKIDSDPEPEHVKTRERKMWLRIKKNNDEGRRTGTGITALGDTLAALGVEYGSDKSIKVTEKIYKELKLACYESSVDMAEELGAFKVFDSKKEVKSEFILRIKNEDPALFERMMKFGRRNIALLTTAPTGSVSILTQTTSGIEPAFAIFHTRRKKINPNDENARVDFKDEIGDCWQEFPVYHPTVEKWMKVTGETDIEKSPWHGSCAQDIDWINRVKIQAAAQKHVCHAISSTINLPKDVKEEKISEIYKEAFRSGCKGITVYRDGCRSGVLITEKDSEDGIVSSIAPKRPKVLDCEVHHPMHGGERFYVVVGLLDGSPYEVFTGPNNDGEDDVFIPKSIKDGNLEKRSRGNYILTNNDKDFKCKLNNGHSDDTADALTRMISTSLRHGVGISFIIHQLEKTKGDLTSFSKILGRTLKKYIKDGSEVHGEECGECKGKLTRESGCVTCRDCGWSKCG